MADRLRRNKEIRFAERHICDGIPPDWGELPANRATTLRHSARYLPILSKATDSNLFPESIC